MDIIKRNPAADIIRCLALFLVISVHFLLHNGFYYHPSDSARMYVMHVFRALFIICVPLFMTLSGFLLRNKRLNVDYYKRISKTIVTYVLASIFCIIYSVAFLGNDFSLKNSFFNILNFSAAPYSWYIEMYLGIFLIIPFLNILYNNIPTQNWKLALIAIFIVLTSLPSVINAYDLSSLDWFPFPTLATSSYNKLIPEWWVGIYPLTYYFIGCYLSEYGLKIKKSLNTVLIAVTIIVFATYTYWRSYKVNFIWGTWCSYESLFSVILTVLVFTLILNLDYSKLPDKLCSFLKKVSGLCLGGYLLSWIFDEIFYPILLKKVALVTDRLEYYFLIVPSVFILSLLLSYILSKVQILLEILYKFIVKAISKEKAVNHKE